MDSDDRITIVIQEPPMAESPMEAETEISQPSETDKAMASDDGTTIPVPEPPPRSTSGPLENIADSPMEDEAEVSQPSQDTISASLPKFWDHLMWTLDRLFRKPYLHRVPNRLCELNTRAYEPNVISIGPYHHGKKRLQSTEALKMTCFLNIYIRNRSVADKILKTMQSLEAQVRRCYEEPSDLNSKDFVEMMVYDGCFIVQLILGKADVGIFEDRGILHWVLTDLLLLENQLPFIVLSELYHIIVPEAKEDQFTHHALSYFRKPSFFHLFVEPVLDENIKHLLHLVHSYQRPSASGISQHKEFKENAARKGNQRKEIQNIFFSQMTSRLWNCLHQSQATSKSSSQPKMKFISSATELDDAGIHFFGAALDQTKEMETEFDIMFTKDTKTMMIPTLNVEDATEIKFRNYIAYEQFIPYGEPHYFTDYVLFMDCLINTSKDVQLLRKSGIIENSLGSDEAIAQMFNRLNHSVTWSSRNFYYAEIFGRVNEHCQGRWNRWKAVLKKNYFNSPWSHISFIAATLLLLLTIAQTIFAVLSYSDDQN